MTLEQAWRVLKRRKAEDPVTYQFVLEDTAERNDIPIEFVEELWAKFLAETNQGVEELPN